MQGPAEKTGVFMFTSIQQCEWRDFQGHMYAMHAREFGCEHIIESRDGQLVGRASCGLCEVLCENKKLFQHSAIFEERLMCIGILLVMQ
jgi:hypothetical protein